MAMRGRKPVADNKTPFYAPALETNEHKEMFAFYASLGKTRSLSKVSKHFGKSISLIGAISRAFRWRERLLQAEREITDPLVKMTEAQVYDSRLKMVFVINDITDTLYQLASLSKELKETGIDEPVMKGRNKKIERLVAALNTYGIAIKNAKDLRDLVGTMKDTLRFNEDLISGSGSGAKTENTQVNIDEVTLVIKDD